ncbi:splicing regulatory glutamine/lysine-rich protein 1-like [Vigna umbellata]|uniref:splicing regulatory glutamine/lysine-rich protein 1-like n=1 Tax=Vigna umbellata TaxID=87088 RepID=UPI001F5E89A5|nr:splicing regulatory glutamine/lysine-rich protein 1-like [Vigna umbellata]
MNRFNRTARQVRGVGKKFTISTLATTLRPSPFVDNLFAEPPLTLDELQERAARFIRIEEMRAVQRRQQEQSSTSGQEKKEGKKPFKPGERIKGQKYRDGPKRARFEKYTPLNMPRARVLEEALSADLIRDCTVLKDKVEELIRAGHLKKFVKEERRTRSPPRRAWVERSDRRDDRRPDRRRSRSRSHDRSLHGTINTISGRFAGGSSASARKRNLRELKSVHRVDVRKRFMPPITFTDEDFHAPDPDQDDPMVITAIIARYSVGKVLVDQGSSVNILYWKTFQQMDIFEDLISPFNE